MFDNMEMETPLPELLSFDYYIKPSIDELAVREAADPGYCSRVPEFVVGRVGYGHIKFLGFTDVRCMDIQQIVKFDGLSVVVYEHEEDKPPLGCGLNKPAEVTLILRHSSFTNLVGNQQDEALRKLVKSCDRQGAQFKSFDFLSSEWKFIVKHFSRFGLIEDEDEDVVMDDVIAQMPEEEEEEEEEEKTQVNPNGLPLSHSLPAHLGLDAAKMHEMRMLMFPEEEDEDLGGPFQPDRRYSRKEQSRVDSPSLQDSSQKAYSSKSPMPVRKVPVPLLEYNVIARDLSSSKGILMTGQHKGLSLRTLRADGFKLESKHETPLSGSYANNVVDAALFMGRSFRVGWGPNGILVHTGTSVGKRRCILSSLINVEKVATDLVVRDEKNDVREELIDLCFSSPLDLHKSLERESTEVGHGSLKIRLQKVIVNRLALPEICRAYISILEKRLEVSGLSLSSRILLMHQVTIWELIRVLFSEREASEYLRTSLDDSDNEDKLNGGYGEDMVLDKKETSLEIDEEVDSLLRRAHFSYWLQDSVCHRVQEEVTCLNDSKDLEHIFLLLTGRQLDAAVELAASKGDVRLAVLLSQAGGSTVNRADMARQLDSWRTNGLDFNLIEEDRLKFYDLLAGNIEVAVRNISLDWKRYLGSIMWYQLPPDTSLSVIIHTYEHLLGEGRAPHPVPVYVDEGPLAQAVEWSIGDRYDVAYYLMLLHANVEKPFSLVKTMLSAFSSTYDALDYHMIWHQRAILEGIGAFCSDDLHVLDMSLISQLLCLGQCHWAIYVVLHMPYREDYPYIQESVIKEILCQYCETWNAIEVQRRFILDLGIPSAWMHEGLATYYEYYGDLPGALEHFLECSNWQKAHSIFMTSVAHSLFLSSKHSEIWRIAGVMEEHKSEIADWDIGAGVYIDYYMIKRSMQHEEITSEDHESDLLEKKNEQCKDFFSRLNQSLLVWGSRFPVDARATYSRMAEQLCILLASSPESSTQSVQMSCFQTMLSAPLPVDSRSSHLQDALTFFTYVLSQAGS